MRNVTWACLCALVCAATSALAGTTGKISGRVTNQRGEALSGATVIVVGQHIGASAGADGRYAILNVPSGTCDVKFLLVGHRSAVVTGVRVSADQTTPLDARLDEAAVLMQEVVIKAKKPVVEVKLTSSVARLGRDEIAKLPVQELQDVVNLQAGVVDGHFRGGRTGEVQYQVDGVTVNNVYDNKSTLRLDRSLLEEVQVISGTFDAEYGQAMSGVVNAVLRRGGPQFRYSAEAFAGGFAYDGPRRSITDASFHPSDVQNYQLTLSGPLPFARTQYLVSGRRYVFDDYVKGRRVFLPTDRSDALANVYHPTGDSATVALGYSRQWSALAKLSTRAVPSVQIDYQAIVNVAHERRTAFAFRENPDGLSRQRTVSTVQGLDWTQTLSAKSFYTLNLRYNSFDYRDHRYDDAFDPRYDEAGPPVGDEDLGNTIIQGVDLNRFTQVTRSSVAKASYVNQVSADHLVKMGAEMNLPSLRFGVPTYLIYTTLGGVPQIIRKTDEPPDYPAQQTYHPHLGAVFAQDEIDWRDLTVRGGVRVDYFNARSTVPSDLANPANAIAGAPPSVPVATEAKVTFSPRLGVSYPVTERSALSFAYGHFSQLPPLGDIFGRADYSILARLQAGGIDYGVLGNPDIKPERTVQYQFGFKQAVTDLLGLDLTLFSKDIRDLLGVEFLSTYNGAEYARLTNVDFGNVIGFTVALDQRQIGPFSAAIDYTWQRARGNSSDPRETATRASAGEDPRPREIPLNWDQRNTLNMTVNLSQPGAFLVSGILRVGSGQPYTPALDTGFGGGLETNSGRKPTSVLLDLRTEKTIGPAARGLTAFARVFNALDTRFNNGFVFNTSGSPYYSRYPAADRGALADPTRFAAPRRVEIGLSINPVPAQPAGGTP